MRFFQRRGAVACFRVSLLLALLSLSELFAQALADAQNPFPQGERISPDEFYRQWIVNKQVDAVIDVRSEAEWNQGHIEGGTLVENLASFGSSSQSGTPDDLIGCDYCSIVVYCRSGARAAVAIEHLQAAGFRGRLQNGQGTSQWTEAGYPLVTAAAAPSVPALCTYNETVQEACLATWEMASQEFQQTATTTTPPVQTTAPLPCPAAGQTRSSSSNVLKNDDGCPLLSGDNRTTNADASDGDGMTSGGTFPLARHAGFSKRIVAWTILLLVVV
jgi:phage shock protein E